MSDTAKWIIGLLISFVLATLGGYVAGNENAHARLDRKIQNIERRLDRVEKVNVLLRKNIGIWRE